MRGAYEVLPLQKGGTKRLSHAGKGAQIVLG